MKFLFVTTSADNMWGHETGLWISELFEPYDYVVSKGDVADIVSISGGDVPIDVNSTKKGELDTFSSLLPLIKNTKKIEDVNINDYDVIFFTGGHGTVIDFPNNKTIESYMNTMLDNNKIVATVCHGVSAFIGTKRGNDFLVKDKSITGFTNVEEKLAGLEDKMQFFIQTKLIEQGSKFDEKTPFVPNIIVDGNIYTGQNPQSSLDLIKTIYKDI